MRLGLKKLLVISRKKFQKFFFEYWCYFKMGVLFLWEIKNPLFVVGGFITNNAPFS